MQIQIQMQEIRNTNTKELQLHIGFSPNWLTRQGNDRNWSDKSTNTNKSTNTVVISTDCKHFPENSLTHAYNYQSFHLALQTSQNDLSLLLLQQICTKSNCLWFKDKDKEFLFSMHQVSPLLQRQDRGQWRAKILDTIL